MSQQRTDPVNTNENTERSSRLAAVNPFSQPQAVFRSGEINLDDFKMPCNDSLTKLKQLRESLNRFNAADANINNDEKRVSFVYPSDNNIDNDQCRNVDPTDKVHAGASKPEVLNVENDYVLNNSGKFSVGGIISTENVPKNNREESILLPKLTDEIDFSGNWKASKVSNGNGSRYSEPFISGGSSAMNKSLDLSGLSTEKLKEINVKFSR